MATIDLSAAIKEHFEPDRSYDPREMLLLRACVTHTQFTTVEDADGTLDGLLTLLRQMNPDFDVHDTFLLESIVEVAKQIGALSAQETRA